MAERKTTSADLDPVLEADKAHAAEGISSAHQVAAAAADETQNSVVEQEFGGSEAKTRPRRVHGGKAGVWGGA